MLDAIVLEKRGIPAAVVGVAKLVMTTGKGMLRSQGYPDMKVAVLDYPMGHLGGLVDQQEIDRLAKQAADQVEGILLGK